MKRTLVLALSLCVSGCSASYCEPWKRYSPPPAEIVFCSKEDGALKFKATPGSMESLTQWLSPLGFVPSRLADWSISGRDELAAEARNVGSDSLGRPFVRVKEANVQFEGSCPAPGAPPKKNPGCALFPISNALSAEDAALAEDALVRLPQLAALGASLAAGSGAPPDCDDAALNLRDPAKRPLLTVWRNRTATLLPQLLSTEFDPDTLKWGQLVSAYRQVGPLGSPKLVAALSVSDYRPAVRGRSTLLEPRSGEGGAFVLDVGIVDLTDGTRLCGRQLTVTSSSSITVRVTNLGLKTLDFEAQAQRDLEQNALRQLDRAVSEMAPGRALARWP